MVEVIHVVKKREAEPVLSPTPVRVPRPVHPLVALGDGLRPFDYARRLLEQSGELVTHHGQPWLEDRYATPQAIMKAANRLLKANGLRQIGGQSEWRV